MLLRTTIPDRRTYTFRALNARLEIISEKGQLLSVYAEQVKGFEKENILQNTTESLSHDKKDFPHEHLNLNVRGMGLSATLAINEQCAALAAEGKRVFRLGLGQSPFPVPEHVTQALRENAHQKDYLQVKGLPTLREAIAGYLKRIHNLEYNPDNMLVGPGTKELMFLMQLVYYGDLVIPTPSWVSYAPQADIIGRHIRWLETNPCSGLRITADALEELCKEDPSRPRLLIMNYPNNPTGYSYNENELEKIAQTARRYRILVLSDEIYSATQFDGRHFSIARYYPHGTIISNGISKWCGAGGWRLGAFVFPKSLTWLLKAMSAAASETYTSTSAPIQHAAVRAFEEHPEMDIYLNGVRSILKTLADYFFRGLAQNGVSVHPAQGGFYLFPNFDPLREHFNRKGIHSSTDLCKKVLEETGVAMLPGCAFGRRPEELSARIAYVDFDGRAALEALDRGESLDEAFIRNYCSNTVEAADRLCEWLHAR